MGYCGAIGLCWKSVESAVDKAQEEMLRAGDTLVHLSAF